MSCDATMLEREDREGSNAGGRGEYLVRAVDKKYQQILRSCLGALPSISIQFTADVLRKGELLDSACATGL